MSTNKVETLITDNMDIWTGAIKKRGSQGRGSNKKIVLYGIKKLRELILDLAVRGLLVPQDPNDEPASVLLDRIESEKQRLVLEESLKTKANKDISEDDKYLRLPSQWKWARLGNLAKFIDYRGKTPNKIETGVRLITAKNVRFGYLDLHPEEFISLEEYKSWMTRGFPKKGDLLFTPEAPLGNVAQIDSDEEFALAQRAICFQFHLAPIGGFLRLLIMAPLFQSMLKAEATGVTAQGIKASKLKEFLVPIPPLPEQHRIVAKVDELMALCDQLEQQTENSIAHHQTLVETLLDALTDTLATRDENGANAFQQAWQRIADNFDVLFTTEESVEKLKQTILQLAVMGKLVPQDPNDEPASVLLEKIAAEKAQLIKDGKIKKQKALPPIAEDEKPFGLPVGWEWVKCNDVCYKITDGEHATPKRSETGHYLLSARNVTNEGIKLEDVDYVPDGEFDRIRKRCDPNVGDILISCSGSVGRVALVDFDNKYSMVRSAAMIRPDPVQLEKQYLAILLRSPYLQIQMKERSKQSAQANLFLGAISNLVFVIPPKHEQYRIVAKVDELMALCDQLKAQLSEAQTIQLHLTDELAKAV